MGSCSRRPALQEASWGGPWTGLGRLSLTLTWGNHPTSHSSASCSVPLWTACSTSPSFLPSRQEPLEQATSGAPPSHFCGCKTCRCLGEMGQHLEPPVYMACWQRPLGNRLSFQKHHCLNS